MALLVSGVALWWLAHLFKRLAPDTRARLGDGGKGLVALVLAASILMMIFGYRMADGAFFWGRHPATVGINNLLMVFALYLTSPGPSKGAIFYRMRHPMLTGVVVWAVAHLLVNGDLASVVLFGWLGVWALVSMLLINMQERWKRPLRGRLRADGIVLAVAVVLYGVIAMIHIWLGHNPFLGTYG